MNRQNRYRPENEITRKVTCLMLPFLRKRNIEGLLSGSASFILAALLTLAGILPVTSAQAQSNCVVPPSDQVSWWPADGDATDIIGANDGTLVGSATFDTGYVGQAFSFSGGSVALTSQPPLAQGFTIETWVNFENATYNNFQSIFNNNQLFLRKNGLLEGNTFAIFVTLANGGGDRAQSIVPPVAGTWTHVAGSWDGTLLKLYVNGQLQSLGSAPSPLTLTTVQAQIGRGEQTGLLTHPFFGRIDEFGIYDRALSATEIQTIVNAGSAGKCEPSTFPDVPENHWAWQFVEAIFSAGLTSGFPDGSYRPDNPVTRAEMAVFIKKGIHGSTYTPPAPDGGHPFNDIAGHWAEAWIEDLYDEGFTSGFPDGTYRPDNQVTRAEMAIFLKKAIHGSAYTSPAPDGSHPFSDIAAHWAEAWIEDLYDEGITSGFPDGTYRPENTATRAEMAVFLVNAFSLALP